MRRSVSSGPRPGVAVSQGILLSCPFSSTPGVPPASPGGRRGPHGPQLFSGPGELARELRAGARGAGSSCQEAWGCCQGGHPCLPCTPSPALRAVSRAPLMKVARRGPLLPSGAPTSQFPGPPGGFITACTGARGTEKGLGLARLPRSPHGGPPGRAVCHTSNSGNTVQKPSEAARPLHCRESPPVRATASVRHVLLPGVRPRLPPVPMARRESGEDEDASHRPPPSTGLGGTLWFW